MWVVSMIFLHLIAGLVITAIVHLIWMFTVNKGKPW